MTERRAESHPAAPRRDRRRRGPALLLALVVMALPAAAPAAAQYREPGSDLQLLPDRQQQLEAAMEEAPYHLGSVRLAPWIGLRSVNYVREVDAEGRQRPGDLTATAGAGLRAYLKVGTHAIAAAHAMPEYAWWQREQERNAVVGHYGLGLFGWFSRVEGEVTARRVEEVSFLSSDLLVREPTTNDIVAASAQVRLLGSLALYGSGSGSRTRVDSTSGLAPTDPALLLDRDGTVVRGGVRYLLRGRRGYVGAGVFSERTEFQAADAARSNEGSSWYAESQLRGNKIDFDLQYDHRELEPDDSAFPGYSAASGHAAVVLRPGWRMQFQLYGLRQLRYSALALDSYVEEDRAGAALRYAIGKGGLQLFYENGDDDYFGDSSRHETVTAGGAWLDVPIRRLNVRLGGRETSYEPDGGPKRKVRELLANVALSFDAPGDW